MLRCPDENGAVDRSFSSLHHAAGQDGGGRERRGRHPNPPHYRTLRGVRRRGRSKRLSETKPPVGGLPSRNIHGRRKGRQGGTATDAAAAAGTEAAGTETGGRKDVLGPFSTFRMRRGCSPWGLHRAEGLRGGGFHFDLGEKMLVI